MKVVFLDFDGPIIPIMSHENRRGLMEKAWPPCIEVLNTITESTGAKIVVSSSWRWGGDTEKLLKMWGASAEVVGITPIWEERWTPESKLWKAVPRGDEIQAYLDSHPEVEEFVIIDDDADMGHLAHRLVQTPFETGLTETHAQTAIAMLQAKKAAA